MRVSLPAICLTGQLFTKPVAAAIRYTNFHSFLPNVFAKDGGVKEEEEQLSALCHTVHLLL